MQTPGLTLDAMQHQVHHLAVEHFPARRAPETVKSCQDLQLQGYAARMWSHFHAYRKLRSVGSGSSLSALFRAWHHRALYHGMRTAAKNKKRSAELRRQRRDRLFTPQPGLQPPVATFGNSIKLCVCCASGIQAPLSAVPGRSTTATGARISHHAETF